MKYLKGGIAKRLMSIVLALCVIASVCIFDFTSNILAASGTDWDGSSTAPTAGGDGLSENTAIIINSAAELHYVVANGAGDTKYYELGQDIQATVASQVGTLAGTFEGSGALVDKIGVKNVTLIADKGQNVGGIIGQDLYTGRGTITNCYFVDGRITNGGTTDATKRYGGIISTVYDTKMHNCFSIGYYPIAGHGSLGNLLTASNVYTDQAQGVLPNTKAEIIQLDLGKMQGEAAKTNMTGFDFDTVWQIGAEGEYPTFRDSDAVPPSKYWDGSATKPTEGGDGSTNETAIIINTAAELYYVVKNGAGDKKYYELGQDIVINDTSAADWTSTAKNWFFAKTANYVGGFKGHIDGKGHKITGLYVNSNVHRTGLFPTLGANASIKNLLIEDSYLTATTNSQVGTVAGSFEGNDVNIYSVGVKNVTLKADKGNNAGGIVGSAESGKKCVIANCYFVDGTITNGGTSAYTGRYGGIISTVSNTIITNCYSIGYYPVSGHSSTSITATNVYTDIANAAQNTYTNAGIKTLTKDQMQGDAAKTNMTGFEFGTVWYAGAAGEYPTLTMTAGQDIGLPVKYDTGKKGDIWSGYPSENFAGGTGTEKDPFIIETAGQLAKLVSDFSATKDKFYKITADIKLNDTSTKKWTENAHQWYTNNSYAGGFAGTIDGCGHIVSGLYVNASADDTGVFTGLFPTLRPGAVIKNIGVVNSSITIAGNHVDQHAGAIAGSVEVYKAWDDPNSTSDDGIQTVTKEDYPRIYQCFADATVKVEARRSSGILGSTPRPVIIEKCFFAGTCDTFESPTGGIIGYIWMSVDKYEGMTEIIDCYVAKQNASSKIASENNGTKGSVKYINCYSSGPQANEGIVRVYLSNMRGENAKTNMPGLFEDEGVWVVRGENETPGLAIFDKNSYSTVNNSDIVTLSFVTNCDLELEPISGKAYSEVNLPTPKRNGYRFAGWYAYAELDVPYELTTFPSYDKVLYAKWEVTGIDQGFESYPNTEYDVGGDLEWYRPTTVGYNADYVHSGARSMHRIGASDAESDFLLRYEKELEVGKTYQISFWATTDQDTAEATVSLVHATWPDINEETLGVVKLADMQLNKGEWKEYTCTFTAETKWALIRTTGGNSIFFDDFFLYSTDDEVVNLNSGTNNGLGGNSPQTGDTSAPMLALSVFLSCALLVVLSRKYLLENK